MYDKTDKIIIDTDCGTDDMFCVGNFVKQHQRKRCKVLGITSVCGNIPTSDAFQNTCRMVKEIFEAPDIPIFQSISSHFNDEHASLFYGKDGHSGALLEHCKTRPRYEIPFKTSEQFLIEELSKPSGGDITLIAIGPLTNLFAAEKRCPGILKKARRIFIMGGNVKVCGNCPKTNFESEYNFGMDGQAAKFVFGATNNITLFPLDLTTEIRFDIKLLMKAAINNKKRDFFEKVILRDFNAMVREGECEPTDERLNIHDVHLYIFYMAQHLYSAKQEFLAVDKDGVISLKRGDASTSSHARFLNGDGVEIVMQSEHNGQSERNGQNGDSEQNGHKEQNGHNGQNGHNEQNGIQGRASGLLLNGNGEVLDEETPCGLVNVVYSVAERSDIDVLEEIQKSLLPLFS